MTDLSLTRTVANPNAGTGFLAGLWAELMVELRDPTLWVAVASGVVCVRMVAALF